MVGHTGDSFHEYPYFQTSACWLVMLDSAKRPPYKPVNDDALETSVLI